MGVPDGLGVCVGVNVPVAGWKGVKVSVGVGVKVAVGVNVGVGVKVKVGVMVPVTINGVRLRVGS